MKVLELLEYFDKKLKSADVTEEDKYAALFFALQLPSICSRLAYPQCEENTDCRYKEDCTETCGKGKTLYYADKTPKDEKMYKYWLKDKKQHAPFDDFCGMTCFHKAIYKLRCLLTHEGLFKKDYIKIRFIPDDKQSMFFENYYFISIKSFCSQFFIPARQLFVKFEKKGNDVYMKGDVYDDIRKEVMSKHATFMHNFCKTESIDDKIARSISTIYDYIFYDENLLKTVKDFFNDKSDDCYEIKDAQFELSVIADDKYFFHEFCDKSEFCNYYDKTWICRFYKQDFETMERFGDAFKKYKDKCNTQIGNILKKEEARI